VREARKPLPDIKETRVSGSHLLFDRLEDTRYPTYQDPSILIRILLLIAAAGVLRADSIVIKNVTLIDGTGAAPRPGATVAITGDRIRSISTGRVRAIKGTRIVDGTGKYLIPGLWDMHVHLWESSPMWPLYIANGVTGVRDMGSDYARTKRWRKEPLAPRVYTSGPTIDGKPSEDPKLPVIVVTNNEEATAIVNKLDDDGSDFIKILSRLTPEAYDAVTYRARILRIPFAGHVPDSVSVWRAIDSRQRSIEHLFGVSLACSAEELQLRKARAVAHDAAEFRRISQRAFETYNEAKCLELFRRSAQFKVYQTPTLSMLARMFKIGVTELISDPRLKYVPASIKEKWENPAEGVDKLTSEQLEQNAKSFNRYVAFAKVAYAAHADLLAGTDTGDPYVLPGFSLHDELQWLVTAGLTPMEALQTATRNATECLNVQAGTIERGKFADAVLLDANPLDDIKNARRIDSVVVRGRLLDRKRLDKMLSDAEAVK
jgi:hypothetical protein